MNTTKARLLTVHKSFGSPDEAIRYSLTKDSERVALATRHNDMIKQQKLSVDSVHWNTSSVMLELSKNYQLILYCYSDIVCWKLIEGKPAPDLRPNNDPSIMLDLSTRLDEQWHHSVFEYNRHLIAQKMIGSPIHQFSPMASGIDLWLSLKDIVMFQPAIDSTTHDPFLYWAFA